MHRASMHGVQSPQGGSHFDSPWCHVEIQSRHLVTAGGDGMCSWDAVESFSNDEVKQRFTEDFGDENLCDSGPKVHNPNNWQVQKVQKMVFFVCFEFEISLEF